MMESLHVHTSLGILGVSWICNLMSFIILGKPSYIVSLNNSFAVSSLSCPFEVPIIHMLDCLILSYSSWMLCSFFFNHFSCLVVLQVQ